MRDYIKSEQYFDEFIAEDTARILKLTQKVNGGEVRLHIAKLIGRVCGAKWPHSVSKQPISTVFE